MTLCSHARPGLAPGTSLAQCGHGILDLLPEVDTGAGVASYHGSHTTSIIHKEIEHSGAAGDVLEYANSGRSSRA